MYSGHHPWSLVQSAYVKRLTSLVAWSLEMEMIHSWVYTHFDSDAPRSFPCQCMQCSGVLGKTVNSFLPSFLSEDPLQRTITLNVVRLYSTAEDIEDNGSSWWNWRPPKKWASGSNYQRRVNFVKPPCSRVESSQLGFTIWLIIEFMDHLMILACWIQSQIKV